MHENEISREIVDAAYKVHRRLGPGLFESVYERVLRFELERRGLVVFAQHRFLSSTNPSASRRLFAPT